MEALGSALEGTDRPLIVSSGVAPIAPGHVITESDVRDPGVPFPRDPETVAAAVAERGVRVSVIRLAPSVHGAGDHGFVPAVIGFAREHGVFAGDARNQTLTRDRRCKGVYQGRAIEPWLSCSPDRLHKGRLLSTFSHRHIHMNSVDLCIPSSEILLAALTSISQGILLTGADRRIIFCNEAFTQITGFRSADILGGTCTFTQGPDTDPLTITAIRQALDRCEQFSGEIVNYTKSGQPFWNDLLISPVHDAAGTLTNYIGIIRDITALKTAELALLASAERQCFLLDRIQAGIVIHSPTTEILYANEAATSLLGASCDEIVGEANVEGRWDFVHEDGSLMAIDEYPVNRAVDSRSAINDLVLGRRRSETNDTAWLMCNAYPVLDIAGIPTEVVVSFTDVSKLKIAERALQKTAERLRLVLEGSTDASWDWDLASDDLYYSPRWWEMAGLEVDEFPSDSQLWMRLLHCDDATRATTELQSAIAGASTSFEIEFRLLRKDGQYIPILARGLILRDGDGNAVRVSGTNTDLTERKRSEERIYQLAFYDVLTALPNRRLLMEQLRKALLASARSCRLGALLFIDLDNFKMLNDTLGHGSGDQLLQQAAGRLRDCVSAADTVGRLGGDEFLVILEQLSLSPRDAAIEAELIGEKILAALAVPYIVAGQEHCTTASIGIALFDESEGEALLKQADLAMYEAKAMGRNTLRNFDARMQTNVDERLAIENDLRRSLSGNEMSLYYQPQVNDLGAVMGAEVLLRWNHPIRGLVVPTAFIPLAESTGLILPIGRWVLRTACAQLAAWALDEVFCELSLSVNISVRQFRDAEFVTEVLDAISASGADPCKLILEMTESLLAENIEEIIVKMNELKKRGVRWSLDDFGTGYSSLRYLQTLPIDELKIDRTFVKEILTSAKDRRITRAIITLAEEFGLNVIAEGVESDGQRQFLYENRCRAYQGYLYGKPLPLAVFEDATRSAKPAVRPDFEFSPPVGRRSRR